MTDTHTRTIPEILTAADVTYDVTSNGYQRDSDGWEHQVFPFTLTGPDGYTYTGTFRAGMSVDYPTTDGFPPATDVLAALAIDSTGTDLTFPEWCNEYGFSDDSIRARDTYRACRRTAKAMRRLFGDLLPDLTDAAYPY